MTEVWVNLPLGLRAAILLSTACLATMLLVPAEFTGPTWAVLGVLVPGSFGVALADTVAWFRQGGGQ